MTWKMAMGPLSMTQDADELRFLQCVQRAREMWESERFKLAREHSAADPNVGIKVGVQDKKTGETICLIDDPDPLTKFRLFQAKHAVKQ